MKKVDASHAALQDKIRNQAKEEVKPTDKAETEAKQTTASATLDDKTLAALVSRSDHTA